MRRAWMVNSLLIGSLFLVQTTVFAQDDTEAAKRAQQERDARLSLEAQQRSQKALADYVRSIGPPGGRGTGGGNSQSSLFMQFRMAIPRFRVATDEYRWALSMESKLDKHLKEIGNQTDAMLEYMRVGRVNPLKVDPQEFKDYSTAELRWETLNSAERIAAFLDFAVAAERQETVSAKTLEFMHRLDGELRRLKWLTSHVK